MIVVRHLTASDPEALEAISGWTHDASFLPEHFAFDRSEGTVLVGFEQEPLERDIGLPAPELVRESWWASTWRMPFVLCLLRVRRATGCTQPPEELEDGSMLGVEWDPVRSVVTVHSGFGRIDFPVEALDVELDITDKVSSVRRRRVGKVLPYDSTSRFEWRWPGSAGG